MLRLILGKAGSGKTGLIMNEIKEAVTQKKRGTPEVACRPGIAGTLLIVPEQYSHEAERELAGSCGDSASLCAEALSFTGLFRLISSQYGGGNGKYLDDSGRLLSMAASVDMLKKTGVKLRVLGKGIERSEMQKMLLKAADELKSSGVDPDKLRASASGMDGILADKLLDMADILEVWEEVTALSGRDSTDKLTDLAKIIRERADLRETRIYIDGFTDFTFGERAVIETLICSASEVTVCLTTDGLFTESENFIIAASTGRQLKKFAQEHGVEVQEQTAEEKNEAKNESIRVFAENMFRWTDSVLCPDSNSIKLRKYENISVECEAAAAEILRLVREEGCRWRDVAVAVRGFEEYSLILKSVFDYYDIPLFISEKESILTKPLPALIYSLYAVAASRWQAEDVVSYMRTGLTGLTTEEIDELEKYIFKWQLDERAWRNAGNWAQNPAGLKDRSKTTEQEAEALRIVNAAALKLARPVKKFIEESSKCSGADEHIRTLLNWMRDMKLAELMESRSAEIERDSAEGRDLAGEYSLIWDSVMEIIEQSASVLGKAQMSTEEFGKLLIMLLSGKGISRIPISLDRVSTGDFTGMRRRNIKHLLVLGASDNRLPQSDSQTGLFSESEKEQMREAQIVIGAGEDEMWREYTLIYSTLSLPSQSIYMSYTCRNADGDKVDPAFVLQQAGRISGAEISSENIPEIRLSAFEPALGLAVENCQTAAFKVFSELIPEKLEMLRRAAVLDRGALSEKNVKALYGSRLYLSASKADDYANCRFKYFCRHGLHAEPYAPVGLKPADIGTFMHEIFELTVKDVQDKGGFETVSDEELLADADRHMDDYIESVLQNFDEKTARFRYLFTRLRENVHNILIEMAEELRRSDFRPEEFELDVLRGTGDGKSWTPCMLSGNAADSGDGADGTNEIVLSGIIDRIDTWEHDGKKYFRVVDYKTGKKKFKLADIYDGVNLQMLLYLKAVRNSGAERYGMETVPAGVMYLPARDDIVSVSGSDITKIQEKKKEARKRSGFYLDEEAVSEAWERGEDKAYIPGDTNSRMSTEHLEILERIVEEKLRDMASNLKKGNIDPNPLYKKDDDNACVYCDYRDICGFKDGEGGDSVRKRISLRENKMWTLIEQEENDG